MAQRGFGAIRHKLKKHSLQCNVTKCLRFAYPENCVNFYVRSFAFRKFFSLLRMCVLMLRSDVLTLLRITGSLLTPGLVFLSFHTAYFEKMLQTCVSMTLPDFQTQMEWYQRCFTTMALEPHTHRQDSAVAGAKSHKGGLISWMEFWMYAATATKEVACDMWILFTYNSTQKVVQIWRPNRPSTVIWWFATWTREEKRNGILQIHELVTPQTQI